MILPFSDYQYIYTENYMYMYMVYVHVVVQYVHVHVLYIAQYEWHIISTTCTVYMYTCICKHLLINQFSVLDCVNVLSNDVNLILANNNGKTL